MNGAYLVVPADYSITSAEILAQSIAAAFTNGGQWGGYQQLIDDFKQGGDGDLQRTYDGLPWDGTGNSFVAAFDDAASFNLGLVAQQSGIPLWAAEAGGGAFAALKNGLATALGNIETLGNPQSNYNAINQGFSLGIQISLDPAASPDGQASLLGAWFQPGSDGSPDSCELTTILGTQSNQPTALTSNSASNETTTFDVSQIGVAFGSTLGSLLVPHVLDFVLDLRIDGSATTGDAS